MNVKLNLVQQMHQNHNLEKSKVSIHVTSVWMPVKDANTITLRI